MGLFDFMKQAGAKILGKDHAGEVTVPLSEYLRQHGIDPSGITFKFHADGTVVMSGFVKDQDTREKAVVIVGNVEGVFRVDDQLQVGAAGSTIGSVQPQADAVVATSAPGATNSVARASAGSDGGWTSKTYTVESGDTLSAISKKMYGDAGKYHQIFEANKPMLKDPDHIYPGQVLRIPTQS